ncbi:glycosyl transferase [Antiquaquibacter soli]|uniref:Glycosyl transferase n=1 Tax=Antiquaquibacter soli TaxID=3064523 RepID=A0ABT9BKP6_9MICO|nr:glycosyl transferase [Protaetiibacter sp. WY-16]MDO7881017.1 glycosyl transferase [Protaetiibacter sp. WY-16]
MTSAPRRTRVLTNPPVRVPSPNATVALLVDALPAEIDVVDFSWRRALFGSYDVLHVHWPEFVVRHRSRGGTIAKRALFALLLARLRLGLGGVRSVWTVHNLRPHEDGGRLERALLAAWESVASARVYMYESVAPTDARARVIRRGDYEPTFGAQRDGWSGERSPGRLLQFGLLRPYKGAESLLAAVRSAAEPFSARIVGAAASPEYAAQLEALAAGDDRASVAALHLDDAALAAEILAAEAVVLPYREMYNSGAALLALTLGRPIVVPESATMRELRGEAGSEWVHLYAGELSGETLDRDVSAFLALDRGTRPVLEHRRWLEVGQRYAQLYRELAAGTRR